MYKEFMMDDIFDRLHREHFTKPCTECAALGVPDLTFICTADDMTCVNYY